MFRLRTVGSTPIHREMQPIATTRAALFPDAPSDAPLTARRPPRLLFSARAWYGFVIAMLITFFGDLVLGALAVWTLPNSSLEHTSSTLVRYVGMGALVAAGVAYGVQRATIRLQRGTDTYETWEDYARHRGLRVGRRTAITTTPLDVFQDGRDRTWTAMLTGRIHGDVEIVVGATAWTTSSGKSSERHKTYFVYLQLPRAVAELYPASSLSRYLRGFSNVHMATRAATTELRLESFSLDGACRIRVAGPDGDVRWRELFDPVTLEGLDKRYDAQWQHVGDDIAFCAGGRRHDRAPVETLDTLCLTAAFMHERMLRAASGDVRPEALAS